MTVQLAFIPNNRSKGVARESWCVALGTTAEGPGSAALGPGAPSSATLPVAAAQLSWAEDRKPFHKFGPSPGAPLK